MTLSIVVTSVNEPLYTLIEPPWLYGSDTRTQYEKYPEEWRGFSISVRGAKFFTIFISSSIIKLLVTNEATMYIPKNHLATPRISLIKY